MKSIITILFCALVTVGFSQAYSGSGDQKGQVGFSLQKLGTGLNISYDMGIGENMSYGFSGVYLLNTDADGYALTFQDRFDIKARFNANIGNVLKLPENMDLYPGLNIGTRNFGAHLGFRYFFTDGFGLYSEAGFPISPFSSSATKFNNQPVFNIGASFNL